MTDTLFEVLPVGHPLRGADLEKTPEEVASLTPAEREGRVLRLVDLSHALLDYATDELGQGRVVATVGLFSGGNDSTVMMHVMRDRLTHAAHANTGIGIERTREFVRQTCSDWGVPLIEKSPTGKDTYRSIVLDQGFPGPGHHYKMFQRLKERAMREVVRELKAKRSDRVLFLAGRRRTESARRASVPEMERRGSVVWVSPIVLWTALDMTTYRSMMQDVDPVPVNEVSALIHMSGECLCGAFAAKGELDEIAMWFPEVAEHIHGLEREVEQAGHPPQVCKWGWGANDPDFLKSVRSARSGIMCSSCDARLQLSLEL